jgi:type IV secretion system protein TrbG
MNHTNTKSPELLMRLLSISLASALGWAVLAPSVSWAQAGRSAAARSTEPSTPVPASSTSSAACPQREAGPSPDSGIRPRPLPHDSRLVVFPYDRNALYPVHLTFNRYIHLEFAEGERVQGSFVNDETEWEQRVALTRQDIFIRSRLRGASGSMTVITNRRRYQIELLDVTGCPGEARYQRVSWVGGDSGVFEDGGAVAPSPAQAVAASAGGPLVLSGTEPPLGVRTAAPSAGSPFAPVSPPPSPAGDDRVQVSRLNMEYAIEGDDEIKPSRVFDDGSRTWIHFASPMALRPAIFSVGKDGQGEPIEYVVAGQHFVLARTYPHGLLLKLGKQEVRIRNRASSCGFFDKACKNMTVTNVVGGD